MRSLFIHNVFFRLIGPAFIGTTIYLLILLINNSVELLDDLFANQELYLCVALAYVVFEANRLAIIVIHAKTQKLAFWIQMSMQLLGATSIMLLAVGFAVKYYFENFLGYPPSSSEYWIFFAIYGFSTILYLTLHFSNLFLYKENRMRIEKEEFLREGLEFEFRNFKREMNPNLLLESLESLIAMIDGKPDTADELIDELSVVYRYILGSKSSELVPVTEELQTVQHLINLFWYQGKDIDFQQHIQTGLCVPGIFLHIVEWLVKSSIHSTVNPMRIDVTSIDNTIIVESERKERLAASDLELKDFERAYEFYSADSIAVSKEEGYILIKIPMLLEEEVVT